jgi:FtsH-binding integral membrane protein
MTIVNIWFISEALHFFIGALSSVLNKPLIINSYCINKADPPEKQALELVDVIGGFYWGCLIMSLIAIFTDQFAHYLGLGYAVFYLVFLLYDVKGFYYMRSYGLDIPRYRFVDCTMHIIFGTGNLLYYLFSREQMINT